MDALSFLGSVLLTFVLLALAVGVGGRKRGTGEDTPVRMHARIDGRVTQDPSSDTLPPLYPLLLTLGLVAVFLMLS